MPVNPGASISRVLIIQEGPLEQFIPFLAAARILRDIHRTAHITLLTTAALSEFAAACPYFNSVEIDAARDDAQQRSALVKHIRKSKFDMAYDFQNDAASQKYARDLKIKMWCGDAPGASHPFDASAYRLAHAYETIAAQLFAAGVGTNGLHDPQPWAQGRYPLASLDWIKPAFRKPPHLEPAYFSAYDPYALIILDHEQSGGAKAWSAQSYAELCRRLFQCGVTPVLAGGSDSAELARQIAKAAPDARNTITRADLFQTATLAQGARVWIGGAGGLSQLAAATQTPGVSLIGQDWTPTLQQRHFSIWDREVGLDRRTPRGGRVVAATASSLDDFAVDDIWRIIENMNVLETDAAG